MLGGVAVRSVMLSTSSPLPRWSCPASSIVELRSRHPLLLPLPVVKSSNSSSTLSSPGGGCCFLRSIANNKKNAHWPTSLSPKASVGGVEYTMETGTDVKFQKDLRVPGCSGLLSLLGTGYREKVFAIIGIKVYAAGFYVDLSITERLNGWKGRSSSELLDDASLFTSIFQESTEKSLQIVLVRDVDGKTFWNALNDVISPRIKEPSANDDSALSTFRNSILRCPLKQGTFIFLTWVEPSKMLVSISSDGFPSTVDAVIESMNVTWALFYAFFGDAPVSPTLKASVANGLAMVLK